jgi:MoaA/NifB/PqqE/SkfB family radical SAM enzyme
MSDTHCKLAQLALNLDMSGMVSPCNITSHWLQDNNKKNFRLNKNSIEEIWSSDSRKELIEAHNNGIKHHTCSGCWNTEATGNRSARQIYNEQLKDIEVLESQPRIFIMKPGNRCNVACRSCNEHTSSSWYKDAYALSGSNKEFKEWLEFFYPHRNTYENNTNLENTLHQWQPNIIFWDLYGGEPLLIPLTYKIINGAIESGSSANQKLQIHTNGTIYDPKLSSMFSKFKEVSVAYSIDAIGKKNDYIRSGSDWSTVIENLNRYRDDFSKHANIKFTIRSTVTPLNVLYLDETYEYFSSKDFTIDFGNVVTDHPYNNVQYLPKNIKLEIEKKLRKYQPILKNNRKWLQNLDHLLNFMHHTPANYELLQNSFIERNNRMDQIRKEKFSDVFLEMYQLLSHS